MTAIPLEVAAPVAVALVGAITALWARLVTVQNNHEKILTLEREKNDRAREAELRQQEADLAEMRKELREAREKRQRDQVLYLRSLGVQPLISLPPAEETPPQK